MEAAGKRGKAAKDRDAKKAKTTVSGPRRVMEAAGKRGKAAKDGEAKKAKTTDHSPKECPVCMIVYDDTVWRPRALPCGHTVCTLCVNKLKQQGHVACPECRIRHPVPEGGQFPISHTVETLLMLMRETEKAPAAGQKEAAGLSSKMRSFLQEQKSSVLAAITACQEVEAQLDQYQTTLRGWGEQQQQLEDRLQGLLDQSSGARELVRQEESLVAAKKEEVKERERQLHPALEALRTAAAEQEARLAVAEVLRCYSEAEEVLNECRGSCPDANTATTVRKVGEASNAALEAFQAVLVAFQADQIVLETHPSPAEEKPRPQSEADSTIEDRLQTISMTSLKAEDLRSPTPTVRWQLEAGRLIGVHLVEGKLRHARISLEAGKVYLHTLKEGPLPPRASAFKVSQLVPPSPPCVVFMDLSWLGSAPRRIHVRLSPDTPRGRQMVLLCTGQRGPSYIGTCLFEVKEEGQPGEHVRGGDYESNVGRGGAALLPGFDEGEYRRSGKAGAVWGYWGYPPRGAQFDIITRDRTDCLEYNGVFGEVVEGLDALLGAVQHTPITDVTIVDCGVVL